MKIIENFDIDKIIISDDFASTPPKEEKLRQKEEYYSRTKTLDAEIIINDENILIDGYTSYLIAKSNGLKFVTVKRGTIQIAKCVHKDDGKEYLWRVPERLENKLSAGKKCLVMTALGIRRVKILDVINLQYMPPKRMKTIIKA